VHFRLWVGTTVLIHFLGSDQRSRPVRATAGTRLAAALAAEKLDEFGKACRRGAAQPLKPRGLKRKRATMDDDDTDADDQNFAASSTEDGSDSEILEISNEEVRSPLT
jgi:hypothetical protein